MMKILLCDSKFINLTNINEYSKVYLMDDIQLKLKESKIETIKLYQYFMRAHKIARELNKKLLMNCSININMHLSLLKLSDEIIFKTVRILEVIKDLNSQSKNTQITVYTEYNKFLVIFAGLLGQTLENVNIKEVSIKKSKINLIKTFIKVIFLLLNSFKIVKKDICNIFFLYNDKIAFDFAKPYLDSSIITYPFFSPGLNYKEKKYEVSEHIDYKFIAFVELFPGFKDYKNNKQQILNSNLPTEIKDIYLSKLFELELNAMMILSLKSKFSNLKNILGLFDTYASIDYVTDKLNRLQNIQTICIPHGINFKYKVHYLSYGTNTYTFWSKNHFERMENSNFLHDTTTKKIITGNAVYEKTLKHLQQNFSVNKNILVVGEYFSTDNYYSSPFNKEVTKELFEILKVFIDEHKDCNLTIRTRLNDEYYHVAQKYISKRIKLSSPDVSMIDEINQNDLVISVFSNALHEALLLEKNVLQVNLLGIENYRDLAKDHLVHYADNTKRLNEILHDWYEDKLEKINYKKHLDIYANNGIFEPISLSVRNDTK